MNFKKWLDSQTKKQMPAGIVAFAFQLYEGVKNREFEASLLGCRRYDADDPDWASEAVFSTEDDLYRFSAEDWETALDAFETATVEYLENCSPENPLRRVSHIACGFVDGDLEEIV